MNEADPITGITPPTPALEAAAPQQDQIALSPFQQQVFDALSERSDQLARMYLGAIAVLQQSSNPDRFPQSAHSLRELMEKAPQYLDLAVPWKKRPALNQMLNDYGEKWARVKTRSACHTTALGTVQLINI
jgi:hypothetical protein